VIDAKRDVPGGKLGDSAVVGNGVTSKKLHADLK
jgi:hypothetical protein